ncbi:MAG: hypothetical protein LBS40_05695 [Burkholderiales bacterium]|nr:hypothetical protein [Burkholderiales bacterium]
MTEVLRSLRLTIFLRVLIVLGFALGVSLAHAQEKNTPVSETSTAATQRPTGAMPEAHTTSEVALPTEFSEEARAEYAEKLKILREQMDGKAWEEALLTTDELSALRPREPQVRFIRTIALTELQRDEEAKSELLVLVSDFPELPEPRNNLAALYAKEGKYTLAQRELELAIAAVPDYAVAHANLADLYLRLAARHYQEAIESSKEAATRRELTARLENLRAAMTPLGKAETPQAKNETLREVITETQNTVKSEDSAPEKNDEEKANEINNISLEKPQ